MNNTTTDADKLSKILNIQRDAFIRDGAPTLAQRRADLRKLKSALITRRKEIEDAVNTDFGHRSRHETTMIEVVGVIEGLKYLDRNLRKFMRPTHRHAEIRKAILQKTIHQSETTLRKNCN
jgi:coniferyl-aldehyde dehydrogenase